MPKGATKKIAKKTPKAKKAVARKVAPAIIAGNPHIAPIVALPPAPVAKKQRKNKAAVDLAPKIEVNAAEQAKRVFNMNRDKERYALVDFTNTFAVVRFTLINMKDGKKLMIGVKNQTDVNCSCMDWKMRGKRNNLNCKHILYVVSQILALDFSVTHGNKMNNWALFSSKFDRIKINPGAGAPTPEKFMVPEDKVLTESDLCAVCYTDFMSDPKENLINCLRCRNVVHLDCFRVWIREAAFKACVYCRDPAIGKTF